MKNVVKKHGGRVRPKTNDERRRDMLKHQKANEKRAQAHKGPAPQRSS